MEYIISVMSFKTGPGQFMSVMPKEVTHFTSPYRTHLLLTGTLPLFPGSAFRSPTDRVLYTYGPELADPERTVEVIFFVGLLRGVF